ncbi:MAG: flagellar basal body P-ring formation chaperone FlgA [Hyphomicrobium sp.]|jgi:flagella basal body P-ring formation protein FlgA|nr:flagellar basal body P-ring formation chaperone FlgA [Hyphomicrobium sp.]
MLHRFARLMLRASVFGVLLGLQTGQAGAQVANGSARDTLEVLVPVKVIYPGQAVSSDMLRKKTIRRQGLAEKNILTTAEEPAGLVARRTLVPGQPIQKDALRRPTTVQQGQPVTVQYDEGPISIVLSAVAIQSGGVGDTITVRNSDTGRIVRATITEDRTLRLQAP